MYTLGIWGFSADKPDHLYHDTGATIVRDGEVIAAINEERMSRIKVLNGFPFASIEECLRIAGIEYKDINHPLFVLLIVEISNLSHLQEHLDWHLLLLLQHNDISQNQ